MNDFPTLSGDTDWYRFSRNAIKGLSSDEQTKFESFGQGEIQAVKYEAIHYAFEKFAAQQPELIAARHLDDSITYSELNSQANRLAGYLVEQGIKPGDHVSLFVQRSIPMLVGILGVLKAGAAYVPQDPRITPTVQLKHIIKKTNSRVILTLSDLRHLVPVPDGHFALALDDFIDRKNGYLGGKWEGFVSERIVGKEDVCFILFTSGTTGFPNGVRVTHKNLTNILLSAPGDLGMAPGMLVSQVLNISFDMAAWEILGALSHGATLLIRGKEIAKTIESANIVIATPSVLSMVTPSKCTNIKAVAVAGEPCPKALADTWSRYCDFYNCCGPTETTIVNTMHLHEPKSGKITIGKPTPNNTVYILNEKMEPCSIGEIGEMWAGGDCVSEGYLGNSSLTKERYKPDPFLGNGRKMFRTRDLGRWTKEGDLEHFGRTDDQVKIRGFRVELDSISRSLESMPECSQAVTLKLDSKNLVSFVRPATVDLEDAKRAVQSVLPYYCTPSIIVPMDEFPKTDRGKIDKRALTVMAVDIQESEKKEYKKLKLGVF